MAEVTKVTETSSQGLEPSSPKLIGQYDQVLAIIANRLSADHAFLFAEPVSLGLANANGNDTEWYVNGVGTVRAMSDLSQEQVSAVRDRVKQILSDINDLATEMSEAGEASREISRLLQAALVFPDNPEVFLVDSRPVIVKWGCRTQTASAGAGRSFGSLVAGAARTADASPNKPSPGGMPPLTHTSGGVSSAAPSESENKVPPSDAGPQSPPIAAPVVRSPKSSKRWLTRAALWSLFVILLVLSGLRLLDACAFNTTHWPEFIRGWLPESCTQKAGNELESIDDAARILQASIRQKELTVAAALAKCGNACVMPSPPIRPNTILPKAEATPPGLVPTPGSPPDVSTQPSQTRPAEEAAPDLDARLTGVERGKIEVTLGWEGSSDLDIYIHCPNGDRISFAANNACGGTLTKDLNIGGGTSDSRPIEHVVWNASPNPEGTYMVSTKLWKRHSETRLEIPFRAILRVGGRIIKDMQGTVSQEKAKVDVFTFKVPIDVQKESGNAR